MSLSKRYSISKAIVWWSVRSVAVAVAVLASWALASPAVAHDPIFLSEDQDSPETGPYLPDGTISFAVYGSLVASGDTRGLEFDLRDGDDLYISLLIPDLEPETALADDDLPTMTLIEPDGVERPITSTIRTPFADPFSGTNYVTLSETEEPASGGRYQIVVTGASPTRFVVAVGTREEFFTPTERSGDKPTSFPGIADPLNEWYTTPADGSASVNLADGEEVDVDVDLIEEELANLEARDNDAVEEVQPAVDEGSGGEGNGAAPWIAPTALAGAAVIGGGLYMRRRRSA